MLSRNRSLSGIRPCIRGINYDPDADSWVAALIAWWIEQDPSSPNYGYPIPERSGVIRWFIRINDSFNLGDSRQELIGIYGSEVEPKSFTFIPAKLADNKILMEADPGYRANLMALSRVERERLLGGNWAVRVMSGMYFKRSEVNIVDIAPLPHDIEMIVAEMGSGRYRTLRRKSGPRLDCWGKDGTPEKWPVYCFGYHQGKSSVQQSSRISFTDGKE